MASSFIAIVGSAMVTIVVPSAFISTVGTKAASTHHRRVSDRGWAWRSPTKPDVRIEVARRGPNMAGTLVVGTCRRQRRSTPTRRTIVPRLVLAESLPTARRFRGQHPGIQAALDAATGTDVDRELAQLKSTVRAPAALEGAGRQATPDNPARSGKETPP